MKNWVSSVLRCPACEHSPLTEMAEAVACRNCGAQYAIRQGVTDFLIDANTIVNREREAVRRLQEGLDDVVLKLDKILKEADRSGVDEQALREFPCLQHDQEARGQVREVLAGHPLKPGEILLELGADHCWGSNLFLDAGCHVIALDITDHLFLAPRRGDPDLYRIFSDMNRVPIADHSIDVVWATSAAHHSWDLKQTFREAARVLRAGGRLFFCCEPMPSWLRYPFGFRFGHEQRKLGINETWITRSTWLRFCREAGLKPELAFPSLNDRDIAERLGKRHIPKALAPLVKPLLKTFQVSIHLLAIKP